MQRIKLLYIITKLELGGAQKQLLDLISSLDKERFDPFLFTAKNGILLPQAHAIKGLSIKQSRFLERNINPLKDLLASIEIYRFIKKNNIRIVHTHSSKAGILGRLAARLANVKIIIHTVHGWSFNDYQSPISRKLFIHLEKMIGKFTDRLVVASYHDKQKGLKNNISSDNGYTLIRYGIDYAKFKIEVHSTKEELGIGANDFVVTNISCFKPQKSPCDFIKLAYLVNKEFPNTKFLLVGDGILRKEIEKLVLKLNLQKQIILTGWRRDIPEILSITDVLVLTSLWEGLPIVVLEAMAAARPIIATDTGGVGEVVIEDKTGFLVPCRGIKKMSEKLVVLIKNESFRRQIGEAAKNNLGYNFTLENMAKYNQDLYKGLMSN
jgi:glycosyltransferase involved in cell wall biosynthesis